MVEGGKHRRSHAVRRKSSRHAHKRSHAHKRRHVAKRRHSVHKRSVRRVHKRVHRRHHASGSLASHTLVQLKKLAKRKGVKASRKGHPLRKSALLRALSGKKSVSHRRHRR